MSHCWLLGGGGGGGSGSGADEVGRGRGSVGGSTIHAGGWCAPVVRGDARGGRSGWYRAWTLRGSIGIVIALWICLMRSESSLKNALLL